MNRLVNVVLISIFAILVSACGACPPCRTRLTSQRPSPVVRGGNDNAAHLNRAPAPPPAVAPAQKVQSAGPLVKVVSAPPVVKKDNPLQAAIKELKECKRRVLGKGQPYNTKNRLWCRKTSGLDPTGWKLLPQQRPN